MRATQCAGWWWGGKQPPWSKQLASVSPWRAVTLHCQWHGGLAHPTVHAEHRRRRGDRRPRRDPPRPPQVARGAPLLSQAAARPGQAAASGRGLVDTWKTQKRHLEPNLNRARFLAPRGKPYRAGGGNKKPCVFPRSRLRLYPKSRCKIQRGLGWR